MDMEGMRLNIIGNDPQKLTAAVTAQFGAASLSGDGVEVEGLDPEVGDGREPQGEEDRARCDLSGVR